MKSILKLLTLVLILSFLISCNDDDSSTTKSLTINLTGLEELGADFVYEGWIIVDGSPVSTGRFTSVIFPQSFTVDIDDLEAATKFVLSIEPSVDSDPAPAATKILAGDFSGNSADVWVAPVTTDANNFTSSTGTFFLRTPTDEVPNTPNNMNDEYGIWFGITGTMPPTAGLDLPTLADGWAYEGWVIGESGPISTGTFTAFDQVDSSNGFSGTQNNTGPPVPGEDFLLQAPAGETFPLDVRNRMVVISIEPVPDNSSAPFAMKPMTGIAGTTTAPATHDLALNLDSLPTGTVTR